MNCPDEVSGPVLAIIERAILNIRHLGWSGNAARCAVEADHVHNLPGLLASYKPDLLRFYLEVEQPIFVRETGGENIGVFEEHWKALREVLAVQSKSQ